MEKLDQGASVACSLNEAEFDERRAVARKSLIPKVIDSRLSDTELILSFPKGEGIRAELERFISLERQCCGFLSFELRPGPASHTVCIKGPPEAAATLRIFAEAIEESGPLKGQEPCARKNRTLLSRAGIGGILFGTLAMVACELPVILAAVGLGGLGAAAAVVRPSPFVEKVAVAAALAGFAILVATRVQRARRAKRSALP